MQLPHKGLHGQGSSFVAQRMLWIFVGQVEETDLQEWLKERVPSYQIPKVVKAVDAIPRNAMGKVNKKDLLARMF